MSTSEKVTFREKDYRVVQEGLANILIPEAAAQKEAKKNPNNDDASAVQSVFYNPIQQFNRDLSVLAIAVFGSQLMHEKRQGHKPSKSKRSRAKKRDNESRQPATEEHGSESLEYSLKRDATAVTHELEQGSLDHSKRVKIDDQQVQSNIDSPIHTSTVTIAETGHEVRLHPAEEILNTSSSAQKPQQQPKPKFKVLDALSATGLRALRYAKEIDTVTEVTANDLSQEAVSAIVTNIEYNNLRGVVKPHTGNAMSFMYSFQSQDNNAFLQSGGKYDVIDLDPYGTAAPFIDAALHAVNDGGLLCVTCTDAGVWASNGYPEKAYALYGGTPMKGYHSHEAGLRLILHSIATSAARYGMAIEPLLSLSIDYYARVFVRVRKSPAEVKLLAGKTMLVYTCDSGCGAWNTQFIARHTPYKARDGATLYKFTFSQAPTAGPICEHCGFKTHLAGPMYGGPIHNPSFVDALLRRIPHLDRKVYGTVDRMEGMLSTVREETLLYTDITKMETKTMGTEEQREEFCRVNPAIVDPHPFFFNPSHVARVLHAQAPPEAALRGAIRSAGYQATRSHTKPGTIRTDAPWTFIWRMMREWVKQKAPIKEGALNPKQAGWKILYGTSQAERTSGTNGVKIDDAVQVEENAAQDKPHTDETPINFDEQLGKDSVQKKLVRYQDNPREHWGPMARAKG